MERQAAVIAALEAKVAAAAVGVKGEVRVGWVTVRAAAAVRVREWGCG